MLQYLLGNDVWSADRQCERQRDRLYEEQVSCYFKQRRLP